VHQAARQAQFFGARPADTGATNPLFRLERAVGVTQHHDGVSGTSKQHVVYDYARRLAWGREDAARGTAAALGALTRDATLPFATCDLANASICAPLDAPAPGATVLVTAWNAQSAARAAAPVRLAVVTSAAVASFNVTDATGAPVVAQLVPASAADAALRTGYYGVPLPPGGAPAWLCFVAPLPAAGFSTFFVTPVAAAAAAPLTHVSVVRRAWAAGAGARDDAQITNGAVTLNISAATGLVSGMRTAALGDVPLAQQWGWYNSSVGDAPNDNTTDFHQASGAYIFRTNSSTFFAVSSMPAAVEIITGPVVSEARSAVAGWATGVARLWAGAEDADFEFTVGPIPNGVTPGGANLTGKEVVIRFATPLATGGAWATDSNCRDMIPRARDYRASWNYTVIEPIAGNYNPVNCRITAGDARATLSVTTDRTQGGASMVDGSLELMVHRRLQQDDRRGVNEPLNEPGLDASGSGLVVRGVHRVSLQPPAAAAAAGKAAVQDLLFPAQLTFSPLAAGASPAAWLAAHAGSFSGLAAPLPRNVHLLTLHAQSPASVLVRLAHLFEAGEDAALSAPASVDLSALLAPAFSPLAACAERTTPGARALAGVPVHTVSVEGEGASTFPVFPDPPAGAAQTIVLAPMQIRTFLCSC
jgi:hypothetical protein